ncbi:MAG: NAD-dependent epimerase/dehydratase family protein [Elusimicrobiaceae bacterium]|nr:NAD-dependent epimerase/dehydratase family protein [Elusimicrobiaceae bacterium]
MKKIALVTGGNGFIGKRLTDALLQEGYKVRILSRRLPKKQPVNPDVSVIQADYQNIAALQQSMQGCSVVYHLAAAIFGFNYEDFKSANAIATQNLVQAANATPEVERFIYMSSLAASGFATQTNSPRVETDEPHPISDYGITKLEGEKAVKTLREGINWTILRAPIVYGGSESGVSKIATWVKRGLMVNTSGNALFSFVHVDDLVEALIQVLTLPGTEKETFFVCEEKDYPWTEFIEQMAQAMGVRTPFMPQAPQWMLHLAGGVYMLIARLTGTQPALNYDKVKEAVVPGHWICSAAKWRALSGQHFTPLKEGLQKSFTKNS